MKQTSTGSIQPIMGAGILIETPWKTPPDILSPTPDRLLLAGLRYIGWGDEDLFYAILDSVGQDKAEIILAWIEDITLQSKRLKGYLRKLNKQYFLEDIVYDDKETFIALVLGYQGDDSLFQGP